jgi:hypothetical protein
MGDLKFWWSAIGEDRALWEPGQEPDDLNDLWDDAHDAADDLGTWENSIAPQALSYCALWSQQAPSASLLGSCERIGLWGLGLTQ